MEQKMNKMGLTCIAVGTITLLLSFALPNAECIGDAETLNNGATDYLDQCVEIIGSGHIESINIKKFKHILLSTQSNETVKWKSQWGDVFEYLRTHKKVNDGEWSHYLGNAIKLEVTDLMLENDQIYLRIQELPRKIDIVKSHVIPAMRVGTRKHLNERVNVDFIVLSCISTDENGKGVVLDASLNKSSHPTHSTYYPRTMPRYDFDVLCSKGNRNVQYYSTVKLHCAMQYYIKQHNNLRYAMLKEYVFNVRIKENSGVSANDGQNKKDSNESEESEE